MKMKVPVRSDRIKSQYEHNRQRLRLLCREVLVDEISKKDTIA